MQDYLLRIAARGLVISAVIAAALCGAQAFAASSNTQEQKLMTLDNPLGTMRILVACTAKTDPEYSQIDWEGFTERDLVIIEQREDISYIVTPPPAGQPAARHLLSSAVNSTKKRSIAAIAGCGDETGYVLIGKDGTRKQRWDEFPPQDELFGVIDAMPMRRFEMRRQKGKN